MTREYNWKEPAENYRYLPADVFMQIQDITWHGECLNPSDGYDVPEDLPVFMQELEDCAGNIRRAARKILQNPNSSFADEDEEFFVSKTLNHEVARLAVIVQCGIMELGHLLKGNPRHSETQGNEGPHLSLAKAGTGEVS